MQIIPAINIKNGRCVKLTPGQFHDCEVVSKPLQQMLSEWETSGASCVHVIDVDGALIGHIANESMIKRILDTTRLPVVAGGGIRSIKSIESVLNLGAKKVTIGTKAVENPAFLREALSKFGADKIMVSIDTKNGMVALDGREKISSYNAVSFAREVRSLGVKSIIYTDVSRNEAGKGPDIEYTKEIMKVSGLDIIVNEGIESMKDLEKLYEINVHGAIIDKALYDKKLELDKAIAMFK